MNTIFPRPLPRPRRRPARPRRHPARPRRHPARPRRGGRCTRPASVGGRLGRTFGIAAGLAVGASTALAVSVSAQTVMIRVLDAESSTPSVGALTYLLDASGVTVRNALTDARGRVLFVGLEPGTYSARVEMIGMTTALIDPMELGPSATVTREVLLEPSAIQLEGLQVELASDRCSLRPQGEGMVVSNVWEEARKALSAASFTDEEGAYRYETLRYDRRIDRETGVVTGEEQERREGYMHTPFESRPAEDLVENGFVQRDGADFVYYAPDATVLLSDPFLDTHCFRLDQAETDEEEGLIGLAFEPTGDNRSVPDISGTMWVDAESAELRWLDYRYRYLDPEMTTDQVGGRVDFRRMPNGRWIVPEWWIRMPVMALRTEFDGRSRASISRYHQTGGVVLEVHEAGGRSLSGAARTGGFEGLVTDSLGVPVPGVRVGVVGGNQEVFTSAEGLFSITGLAEGQYRVRFVDPTLESIGHVPNPLERFVIPGELTYLEVNMPSLDDVLFDALDACADDGIDPTEGEGVIVGAVLDRRGRPVRGAVVEARWLDYLSSGSGDGPVGRLDHRELEETRNTLSVPVGDDGAFRLCGVPRDLGIELLATVDEQSTEAHEAFIPVEHLGDAVSIRFDGR